jgi:hypothetical protein
LRVGFWWDLRCSLKRIGEGQSNGNAAGGVNAKAPGRNQFR